MGSEAISRGPRGGTPVRSNRREMRSEEDIGEEMLCTVEDQSFLLCVVLCCEFLIALFCRIERRLMVVCRNKRKTNGFEFVEMKKRTNGSAVDRFHS